MKFHHNHRLESGAPNDGSSQAPTKTSTLTLNSRLNGNHGCGIGGNYSIWSTWNHYFSGILINLQKLLILLGLNHRLMRSSNTISPLCKWRKLMPPNLMRNSELQKKKNQYKSPPVCPISPNMRNTNELLAKAKRGKTIRAFRDCIVWSSWNFYC